MIACPACGIQNEDTLDECGRCRAPLRGDPAATDWAALEAGEEASSSAFGGVCPSCDSYNEPGIDVCASCGHTLDSSMASPPGEPSATVPAGPKACARCGAENPGAARFCFNCGAPFASAPAPAPAADEWEGLDGGATFEEIRPPFPVSLVVEEGSLSGAAFALTAVENRVGAEASHVQLAGDPFVAPHAATLLFLEDRLVLRDEGSANGVYVKVRGEAALEPFDHFIAGARLLRYEGPIDVAGGTAEDGTPILGAPRPHGRLFRVREVLAGGRSGHVFHKPGPVLTVGRGACDLRFPADASLAERHATIHVEAEGLARLVDAGGSPAGVWLRLRRQRTLDLESGDRLQVGTQRLRVEIG